MSHLIAAPIAHLNCGEVVQLPAAITLVSTTIVARMAEEAGAAVINFEGVLIGSGFVLISYGRADFLVARTDVANLVLIFVALRIIRGLSRRWASVYNLGDSCVIALLVPPVMRIVYHPRHKRGILTVQRLKGSAWIVCPNYKLKLFSRATHSLQISNGQCKNPYVVKRAIGPKY